jgi:uncharacterized protein YdeI (YjbR/CyaY-like superfamily)
MSKPVKAKSRSIAAAVEIPAEFQKALAAKPAVLKKFEAMPPSHRRDYVKWITEAKKDETRLNRIERALSMILKKS